MNQTSLFDVSGPPTDTGTCTECGQRVPCRPSRLYRCVTLGHRDPNHPDANARNFACAGVLSMPVEWREYITADGHRLAEHDRRLRLAVPGNDDGGSE